MSRKNKHKRLNWKLYRGIPRWQIGGLTVLIVLLLYALLKVLATSPGFFGVWLATFLDTIEGIFTYLAQTVLSPIGLVLIAFIWLIKTGDLFHLFNKIRYMQFTKDTLPLVHYTPPAREETNQSELTPLNAWQRSLLGEIERTSNISEQKDNYAQLVIYEHLSERQAVLPLLQFLHHYRRNDISFFQVAQFLTAEGFLDQVHLSGQELAIESEILGYMGYLQHAGLIEAQITLQPAADGFYGTIHKVKIPRRVQEVMALFSQ